MLCVYVAPRLAFDGNDDAAAPGGRRENIEKSVSFAGYFDVRQNTCCLPNTYLQGYRKGNTGKRGKLVGFGMFFCQLLNDAVSFKSMPYMFQVIPPFVLQKKNWVLFSKKVVLHIFIRPTIPVIRLLPYLHRM